MANNPIIFGQSTNNVAVPHSLGGMPGWWKVPPAGVTVAPNPNATNEWIVTDTTTGKIWYACMDGDGTMVFQDQLADKIAQNGEQGPGDCFNS